MTEKTMYSFSIAVFITINDKQKQHILKLQYSMIFQFQRSEVQCGSLWGHNPSVSWLSPILEARRNCSLPVQGVGITHFLEARTKVPFPYWLSVGSHPYLLEASLRSSHTPTPGSFSLPSLLIHTPPVLFQLLLWVSCN